MALEGWGHAPIAGAPQQIVESDEIWQRRGSCLPTIIVSFRIVTTGSGYPRLDSASDSNGGGVALTGRWITFGVITGAFLMASIDQTIVATALPAMQDDLGTSLNWIGWTVTIYALGRVIVLPVAGRLADQHSPRTIFAVAVVVFTLASLGCGLVSNVFALITLRAVQSLGGGAFLPAAVGIVAECFGPDRDRAISMFTSVFQIGSIIGPVLGGIFVGYWSWRWIFLVNVPIGIIVFPAVLRFIPSTKRRSLGTPMDKSGMLMLAVTVLATMLAITYLGEPSANLASWLLLVPSVIAIVTGAALVRHIRVAANPFITRELLRGRGLGVLGFMNFLFGGAVLGLSSLVPLYATERYGIAALASGTLLTARAVAIMVTAVCTTWFLRRTGYRIPIAAGFAVTALGLVLMAWSPEGMAPFEWLTFSSCMTGIGMGIATPAVNNAALYIAPEQVSAVTGLRAMFLQGGGIIAVAISTAILSRATSPGAVQAWILAVYSLILLFAIPLVTHIPDRKGSW